MKKTTVAFQGEHGAYSEAALKFYFGNSENINSKPCDTFFDTLNSLRNNNVDYAILPVENSLAGTVVSAYDELLNFDLVIHHEVKFRIEHHLMTLGDDISKIKNVYSHPQALGQCVNNIKKCNLNAVAYPDTAGAAKYIIENNLIESSAIASKLASEIYGLKVLKTNFEDESFNSTRFYILSNKNIEKYNPKLNYKTSIIFSTRHKPNALTSVLNCLSDNNLNMTKIFSKPSRYRAWDYLFFVDFIGHVDDEYTGKAFLEILKYTSFLKILGSFTMSESDS